MIIAVSGTPGTGKTTFAKNISERLDLEYIDVNKIINQKKGIILERDAERDTCIIDDSALIGVIEDMIVKNKKRGKNGLVVDSHLSHMLSPEHIDICIILSCDISVLKKRLVDRGYNDLKVKENLEVETFDEILEEAKEFGHKPLNINTEEGYDIENVLKDITEKSQVKQA